LRAFLDSSLAATLIADRKLAGARILGNPSGPELPADWRDRLPPGAMILEHPPVPFRNYPYEWSAEMLHSAAALTLELALAAMRAGFVLKDATPYNVMFDGPQPVFLDVLSFRRREPTESIWQPYAQFIRSFVFPLLACRYFGLRLDEILLTHRDGLEPDRVLALCPFYRLLLPPFLSAVTIPVLLARREHLAAADRYADRYEVRRARDAQEAEFILERLFARAGKLTQAGAPRSRAAQNEEASRYLDGERSYSTEEFAQKERHMTTAFERWSPRNVLDIGCNSGRFSRLAARNGARVVAIDRDADAVGALWQSASEASLCILTLALDIGRPPGACGWRSGECTAFLDRARGRFDCVLMLALIHHLLVNERVPLEAIFELASELTTRLAIVEYIDPADPLFRRITRGRDALHRDVTRENFEAAACRWFHILDANDISPTRRIYILRRSET
jgi:SAM-dependent methyltransferase